MELCGKYKVFPLLNVVTPFFISKFKFPLGNQPIGKVWLKIYVQFYFGGVTLKGQKLVREKKFEAYVGTFLLTNLDGFRRHKGFDPDLKP